MPLCSTWDTELKASNCIDVDDAIQPILIFEILNIRLFHFTFQKDRSSSIISIALSVSQEFCPITQPLNYLFLNQNSSNKTPIE